MIRPEKQIILASGEAITVAEIAEAFQLLANSEVPYPILSRSDEIKAAVALAFELLELQESGQ